jgi:hypothetical protein
MVQLIYSSVHNPDRTEPNPGGGTRYYYKFEGEELRTAVSDNGYLLRSHPDLDN